MKVRVLSCREHGGKFKTPMKAGRPPTRCGGANGLCDAVNVAEEPRSRPAVKPNIRAKVGARQSALAVAPLPRTLPAAKARRKVAESVSEVVTTVNHAVPLAHKAKGLLEPLGWTVKGRAWLVASEGPYAAEITATRDTELLVIRWTAFADGHVDTEQQYSLWDVEKPITAAATMPQGDLDFNPDELSDSELIREISGRKVVWWNRIGTNMETASVGDRIQIDHTYNSTGDELPGDRVIKFADHNGGGFRAFRAAALISVR